MINDVLSGSVYLATKMLNGQTLACGVTLTVWGTMILGGSSTAMHTKVDAGGMLVVYDNALAYNTTVHDNGSAAICGTADVLTVSSGGFIHVLKSARVRNLLVCSGGRAVIDSGAICNHAIYQSGSLVMIANRVI